MNENIKKVIARKSKFLLLILFCQCIFIFVAELFLSNFLNEFAVDMRSVKICISGILIVNFMLLDITFWFKHILALKKLVNTKAEKCVVTDILVLHIKRGRHNYVVLPIVKSLNNGKRYFTYGRYNESYYNSKHISIPGSVRVSILREDGSEVAVGNIVNLYINNLISVKVRKYDNKKFVKFNGKKLYFYNAEHINWEENIDFFEGVIDIENT